MQKMKQNQWQELDLKVDESEVLVTSLEKSNLLGKFIMLTWEIKEGVG